MPQSCLRGSSSKDPPPLPALVHGPQIFLLFIHQYATVVTFFFKEIILRQLGGCWLLEH